ncbi:Protein artemis [Chytridiales sp. JEL 0842]|nr:Protein artemis [Chytridiales sp. JEL 0842]
MNPADPPPKSDLRLVNYSEKTVAVFGNTKACKDQLKSMGGKFNMNLSQNGLKVPGWIFPTSQKGDLEVWIKNYTPSTSSDPFPTPAPTVPPASKDGKTTTKGGVKWVDYSAYSIAVYGDTIPIKEELKALGGKFNKFLTIEGEKRPGWILGKDKKGMVLELVGGVGEIKAGAQSEGAEEVVVPTTTGGEKDVLVEAPKPQTQQQQQQQQQQSTSTALPKIITYSAKSIAVYGNTIPIKDKLKVLGARFNKFLNIEGHKQAGWVLAENLRADADKIVREYCESLKGAAAGKRKRVESDVGGKDEEEAEALTLVFQSDDEAAMSTFDGRLAEFPFLSIDHFIFKDGVVAYLLSHCHADHLTGLESFEAPLYCTEVTARMVLNIRARPQRKGRRVMMQPKGDGGDGDGDDTLFQPDGKTITVTPISANHCPGSCMFLIESASNIVLYTGDMRADASFVEALLKKPVMKNLEGKLKVIDKVYLDTTFCSAKFYEFPTKQVSVDAIVKTIRSYSSDHIIYINSRSAGCEDVWIGIAKAFKTKIHVSRARYQLYASFAPKDDFIPPFPDWNVAQYLTTNGKLTRFHACHYCEECVIHAMEDRLISLKPSAMFWVNAFRSEKKEWKMSEFVLVQENQVNVLYSMHSSFAELRDFIRALRPKAVHPCVVTSSSIFSNVEIPLAFRGMLKDSLGVENDDKAAEDNSELERGDMVGANVLRKEERMSLQRRCSTALMILEELGETPEKSVVASAELALSIETEAIAPSPMSTKTEKASVERDDMALATVSCKFENASIETEAVASSPISTKAAKLRCRASVENSLTSTDVSIHAAKPKESKAHDAFMENSLTSTVISSMSLEKNLSQGSNAPLFSPPTASEKPIEQVVKDSQSPLIYFSDSDLGDIDSWNDSWSDRSLPLTANENNDDDDNWGPLSPVTPKKNADDAENRVPLKRRREEEEEEDLDMIPCTPPQKYIKLDEPGTKLILAHATPIESTQPTPIRKVKGVLAPVTLTKVPSMQRTNSTMSTTEDEASSQVKILSQSKEDHFNSSQESVIDLTDSPPKKLEVGLDILAKSSQEIPVGDGACKPKVEEDDCDVIIIISDNENSPPRLKPTVNRVSSSVHKPSSNVSQNTSTLHLEPVPVKRGRGRPRKDGATTMTFSTSNRKRKDGDRPSLDWARSLKRRGSKLANTAEGSLCKESSFAFTQDDQVVQRNPRLEFRDSAERTFVEVIRSEALISKQIGTKSVQVAKCEPKKANNQVAKSKAKKETRTVINVDPSKTIEEQSRRFLKKDKPLFYAEVQRFADIWKTEGSQFPRIGCAERLVRKKLLE